MVRKRSPFLTIISIGVAFPFEAVMASEMASALAVRPLTATISQPEVSPASNAGEPQRTSEMRLASSVRMPRDYWKSLRPYSV